jgi:hypothetical protein
VASLADYLTDNQLRVLTRWRLLAEVPKGIVTDEQLAAITCGVPDLLWVAGEMTAEDLGGMTAVSIDVTTERIAQGGLPAFAALLVLPGLPDLVITLVELRGGYSLGAGDYLEFTLQGFFSNEESS